MMKWIDTISYSIGCGIYPPFGNAGLQPCCCCLPISLIRSCSWPFLDGLCCGRLATRKYLPSFIWRCFSPLACCSFSACLRCLLNSWNSSNSGSAAGSLAAEKAGWVLASWEPISLYVPEASLGLAGPIFTRILACLACMFFITLNDPVSRAAAGAEAVENAANCTGAHDHYVSLYLSAAGYGGGYADRAARTGRSTWF